MSDNEENQFAGYANQTAGEVNQTAGKTNLTSEQLSEYTGQVDQSALAHHIEQPSPLNPQQVLEHLQTEVVQLKMRAGELENRLITQADVFSGLNELDIRLQTLETFVTNIVTRHSLSDGSK